MTLKAHCFFVTWGWKPQKGRRCTTKMSVAKNSTLPINRLARTPHVVGGRHISIIITLRHSQFKDSLKNTWITEQGVVMEL